MLRHETTRLRLRVGLAILLVTAAAGAKGVAVEAASKAQLKEAKQPFLDGMAAMEAGKFQDAAKNFQASYDIVASPNSRLMLARALIQLGRFAEAYRELEGTVSEASGLAEKQKKYRSTADSAQTELNDLKPKLAFVTVVAGTRVELGAQSVAPSDWGNPLPLTPGTIAVTLTDSDGKQRTQQMTFRAGEKTELKAEKVDEPCPARVVAPPPPPPKPAPPPPSGLNQSTVGYVVGGVGLVGVSAYVGLVYLVRDSKSELTKDCSGGQCPEPTISDAETRGTLTGLGYAGLGIGVVGLGVGTFLVLTAGPSKAHNQPQASLRIGPGSVQLQGRF